MYGAINPPDFPDLSVSSIERNKVTYVSYSTFDFQDVWAQLKAQGAESINITPNPDCDCLDVEVFFSQPGRSTRSYATWQIVLSSLCALGITAAALCPPLPGTNG